MLARPELKRAALYPAADVLPHGEPMRLIEEIVEYSRERIVACAEVRADSLFCEVATGVPAWVGIEYMAQTVAAYSGIEEVQQQRAPSIGLLLGSRNYEAAVAHFSVGARLEIVATLLHRDADNLVAFHCEILQDAAPVARADIKAYRPANIRDLLNGGRNG